MSAGRREPLIVATLSAPPPAGGAGLAALHPGVRCIEVRADLTGEVGSGWLRSRFSGQLLYTLRSRAHGGGFAGSAAERRRRLLDALERYDLVDLEIDDLEPELLDRVPWARRVVSWHGEATTAAGLRRRFQRMSTVRGRLYRLVPAAASPGQALAPLELLRALRRPDVTAFASGAAGSWSRLLAPRLGAPVVFGEAGAAGLAGADGVPAVERLLDDYRVDAGQRTTELYGIAAGPRPFGRSLSPLLHNGAHRALGTPGLYLPFQVEDFQRFWRELVREGLPALGLPLRGVTVTAPHKEAALGIADRVSPLALRAGAANVLHPVDRGAPADGGWRAATTDAVGVLGALAAAGVSASGRKAAVIGCGGAGRAAAIGLRRAGAEVTLVNRGLERGAYASRLLGLEFVPLADFAPGGFSLVVHATPLTSEPPLEVKALDRSAVVVELVYGGSPTPLATAARAHGCTVVDGLEVLLVEARRQFRLMTGRRLPQGLARRLLGEGVTAPAVERLMQMEVEPWNRSGTYGSRTFPSTAS